MIDTTWEPVVSFRAFGIPKGQPRPRAFFNKTTGRASVYEKGTAEGWKGDVALAYGQVRTKPIDAEIYLVVRFYFPVPKYLARKAAKSSDPLWHSSKPDVDNVLKATMDALTGAGAWIDDNLVVGVHVEKRYATAGIAPGAEIDINRRSME